MKQIINGLLVVAIIVLVFLCVRSIMTPIEFENEKDRRDKEVVQKLVDIRKAQAEYRKQNQQYTGSFDTLITFLNTGKVPVIKSEGVLTDDQLKAGLTEVEAVKQGLIIRDTTFVNAKEFVFGKDYDASSIALVPWGNGAKFEMAAKILSSSSGLPVPVFEAKVPFDVYLSDLDRQELINLNDKTEKLEKYKGMKVGSIEEANNNAGNWE